jgi:hypothetical protein
MPSRYEHAIGYIPGNLIVVNTTVLNANQIGDDVASPIDTLAIYCTTDIGSTSNGRSVNIYPPAAGKVLIDADTIAQTQTDGLLDIDITTSTNTGISGINVMLTTHNLANAEWAYGQYMTYDATAAVTATSNVANIYMAAPTDPGATVVSYGLYIEAGYDFGFASLSPVMLSSLILAPAADPTPYPLDFQLEGFGVAGTGTANVYTQGRVVNAEYGAARTLDGALHFMYIDLTTNVTANAQNVVGAYFSIPGSVGAASYGLHILTAQDQGNVVFLDINSTVPAFQTTYGVYIDADGVDASGGNFYGIYLDMDGMTTGATIEAMRFLLHPTQTRGLYIFAASTDGDNSNIMAEIQKNVGATGAARTMTNSMVDLRTDMSNSGVGNTVSWNDYFVDMNLNVSQADATSTFSGGFIDMTMAVTLGTASLQGDMVRMTLVGTIPAGQTLRGYYLVGDSVVCGAGETFTALDLHFDDATTGGTLTGIMLALPASATGIDFVLEDEYTIGTVINADFGGATIATGAVIGIILDFSTNLDVTANTTYAQGLNITSQANSANHGNILAHECTHATNISYGLSVTWSQTTNDRAAGAVSAVQASITGRVGDAGGTYAVYTATHTDPGGAATYVGYEVASALDSGIFYSAGPTTGINFAAQDMTAGIYGTGGYVTAFMQIAPETGKFCVNGILMQPSGTGAITTGINLNTTGMGITNPIVVDLEVFNNGTVMAVSYSVAEVLTGALTGISMDFGTNVTMGAQQVTGVSMTLTNTDDSNAAIGIDITKNAGAVITADRTVTGTILNILSAVTNTSAGDFDIANSQDGIQISMSHELTTTTVAKTNPDTFSGAGLVIDIEGGTNAANDQLTMTAQAIDINYQIAEALGTMTMNAFSMMEIDYDSSDTPSFTGGVYNMLSLVADDGGVPAYAATVTFSGIRVDVDGMDTTDGDLVLQGMHILLPTAAPTSTIRGIQIDLGAGGSAIRVDATSTTHTTVDPGIFIDYTGNVATDGAGALRIDYNYENTSNNLMSAIYIDIDSATATNGTAYGIYVNVDSGFAVTRANIGMRVYSAPNQSTMSVGYSALWDSVNLLANVNIATAYHCSINHSSVTQNVRDIRGTHYNIDVAGDIQAGGYVRPIMIDLDINNPTFNCREVTGALWADIDITSTFMEGGDCIHLTPTYTVDNYMGFSYSIFNATFDVNGGVSAAPANVYGYWQTIDVDLTTAISGNIESAHYVIQASGSTTCDNVYGISTEISGTGTPEIDNDGYGIRNIVNFDNFTVAGTAYGFYLDMNGIIQAGQSWYGFYMDAVGVTCGAGEFYYGIYIDISTITSGGTIEAVHLHMDDTATAIYIDQATVDVGAAGKNLIYADVNVDGLNAAVFFRGLYLDIDETEAGTNGSFIQGARVDITGFATGMADLFGFTLLIDGTKSGGDITRGFYLNADLTLNNAGEIFYGANIDMDGLTNTNSSVALGIFLHDDKGDAANTTSGMLISHDLAAAITADRTNSGQMLEISSVISNTTAGDFDVTNSVDGLKIEMSHTINSGVVTTDPDTQSGTALYIDMDSTTTQANEELTSTIRAINIDYTLTETVAAGLIRNAVNIVEIDYDTSGGVVHAAGTYNMFAIFGDDAGTPGYDTSCTVNGILVDIDGMNITDGDLTLQGMHIMMPTGAATSTITGIQIDLGQGGSAISIDNATADIVVGAKNIIFIDADVGDVGAAGRCRGVFIDIDETVAGTNGSWIVGYQANVTGFSTGRANLYGLLFGIDGTKDSGDISRGIYINSDITVSHASEELYGIDLDFDGTTVGAANALVLYGIFIRMDAITLTGTPTTQAGIRMDLPASGYGIYIDNAITDVGAAGKDLIFGDVDVGGLTGTDEFRGVFLDIDEMTAGADGTFVTAFETDITGLTAGRSDFAAFKATFDGTFDTGADLMHGILIDMDCTMNFATKVFSGLRIESDGLTKTAGILYGIYTYDDGVMDLHMLMESTSAGATGPNIRFYHNSSTVAVNDDIGIIEFYGRNAANNADVVYAEIRATVSGIGAGVETGYLEFWTARAGASTLAAFVDNLGTIHVDALDGGADPNVAELTVFDAFDDVGLLRGFARRENVDELVNLGIMSRYKGMTSINLQMTFQLIAGGIYQNRDYMNEQFGIMNTRIESVEERLTRVEKENAELKEIVARYEEN